jgi:branched-subunit amino acid transport protein
MDQKTIFLTILGMMLVTYLPRLAPVWFLSSRSLPPLARRWLRLVPVAVLSALLFPSLLMQGGQVNTRWDNLFLLAAIPAALVAWRTRSLFGAVLTGMALVAAGRYFFGW